MRLDSIGKVRFEEKTTLLIVSFILISLTISAFTHTPDVDPEPVAFRTGETDLEYVKTDPILVDGEDGFDGEHWDGNGSEENPYELKETYEIDATGEEYGIKIKNSSKHVVIENTEIYGASGS
ncbi:MAG: hypothetical protein V5A66_05550, partial [Candidatus Thermoplasmatota archaeon]